MQSLPFRARALAAAAAVILHLDVMADSEPVHNLDAHISGLSTPGEHLLQATQEEPPLSEVDVLVVYTTAARDGAGGVDPLKSAILAGFAEANQIHSNSLTRVRLNPVAIIQSPSAETGSLVDDLLTFASNPGPALRSDYRADLVMLLFETDKSETSGGAGPGRPGAAGNSAAAYFSVQRTRPWGLGEGIANRSGILLGCGGERPSKGAFPVAVGHRFVVDGIEVGTIMADGGMTIPHFSNPDVLYRGEPTGVAGETDNAVAIRQVGPKVATYQRCSNRVRFEQAAVQVYENEGMVRLQVVRTGLQGTTAQLRCSYSNGTAREGIDFAFSSRVIEFLPGETIKTIEVPILNNDVAQDARRFQLRLTNPVGETGLGMNAVVEITLEDDDVPFRLSGTEGFLVEGGVGTTLRVTRKQGLDSAASVSLGVIPSDSNESVLAAIEGQAPPVALPLSVRFEAGQSEVAVQITVPEDADAGPDRAVKLGLQGPWPEGVASTVLTLWVRDNDRLSRSSSSLPAQVTGGEIEGPVLPLPDGSFLAGRRRARGAAIQLDRYLRDGSTDPQWPELRFQETPDAGAGLQFGRLNQIVRQPDGKILVAGFFSAVNTTLRNSLVRLLPDGRIDPDFQIGGGFDGPVRGICVQPDGGIVAVGAFRQVDGVTRTSIARLMSEGSLDDSFQPQVIGSFAGFEMTAVAMQGDKILISGQFTAVESHQAAGIARLNLDGTPDSNFRSVLDGVATSIRVLPGGEFYALGPFMAPVRWLGMFKSDGAWDSRRRFRGLNGSVLDILPLAGGESYVCGRFAGLTTSQPLFVRYRSDGTVVEGFGPRFHPLGAATALVAEPSGELTLVGGMTLAGGNEVSSMVRLPPGSWSTELKLPQRGVEKTMLEAQTVPGLIHRLERSQDLVRWEVVETLDATSHSAWFRDASPVPTAFYRLSAGEARQATP